MRRACGAGGCTETLGFARARRGHEPRPSYAYPRKHDGAARLTKRGDAESPRPVTGQKDGGDDRYRGFRPR
jgi:hypothetical protein